MAAEIEAEYRAGGIEAVTVSAMTGAGIAELRLLMLETMEAIDNEKKVHAEQSKRAEAAADDE
jgi:translation initiation factor IF-2